MSHQETDSGQAVAFAGPRLIGAGPLAEVAVLAKVAMDQGDPGPILIFDRTSSEPIDLDFRGTVQEVAARLQNPSVDAAIKGRGRPRLGVMAREVTLLPRHWTWLSEQRGGASAALRRLVDEARQTRRTADQIRQSRQSAYRFITAMAGDEPGYEEATRALFAGDGVRFRRLIAPWPLDVGRHAEVLAAAGLDPGEPGPAKASEAWR